MANKMLMFTTTDSHILSSVIAVENEMIHISAVCCDIPICNKR